jgi:GTP-binding protein lepA
MEKIHGAWYSSQRFFGRESKMENRKQDHIRNFCIIAHIDHGKSTLADRIIEKTGTLTEREMQSQVLDNMDIERERGITIKSQTVRIVYKAEDGEEYIFNLIDTPGHVDFNYEVSRALAACDGAILVVDATQGIQAQTLANTYLALDHNLEIIPVINKVDLPSADPELVAHEIEDVIGIEAMDAPQISAKTGLNVEAVLEAVVKRLPAPQGSIENPLQALVFDSLYDSYRGVIIFCRIKEGSVKKGSNIRFMATGAEFIVTEVGTFAPGQFIPAEELTPGMVGYFTASIKNIRDARVGDTVTTVDNPAKEALPGYKKVQSMVYCGIYPSDSQKYPDLRDALEKLQLNDAALNYEAETSVALGFGFRCGFLGLLHLDVVQERLEREYDLDLVTTAPSVIYHVYKTDGSMIELTNPSNLPDPAEIAHMEEPIVEAEIMVTSEFVGAIMTLCQERRGIYKSTEYIDQTRAVLKYDLPLNEIIYDFFDALKSRSRGYASFDYELKGYQEGKMVKLDILVNKQQIDALSFIVHADSAYERGKKMCEKLKNEIPRQLFEIPIQAAIGGHIVARETVKALRKDVLAKCYGGDISRKKKLLEKQKEGKKRMRQFGNVEIPQSAFMSVLKLDED